MATPTAANTSSHSGSQGESRNRQHDNDDNDASASVPVETLVEHLLAAKQSLSSMTLVLQANELATHARKLHEESVILGAQTAFLRKGIDAEVRILLKLRRGLVRTYDGGKREFKHIIKTLDSADAKLRATMTMLRDTMVEPAFRPPGEEPRSLLDFVDEQSVDDMVEELKAYVGDLQAAQTAFDDDLSHFEDDLRNLNKILNAAPTPPTKSTQPTPPISDLISSLTAQSTTMAEHLTGLTRHFDMCVRAIRITEGGAALAKRKAAESAPPSQQTDDGGPGHDSDTFPLPPSQQDPVSISGVIAEQESHSPTAIDNITASERAEILQVVVQDAPEVPAVLEDLHATLAQMQIEFTQLESQTSLTLPKYQTISKALHLLEEIGTRLPQYAAAEPTFLTRVTATKQSIFDKLTEMDSLRDFYEGYANAYDTLILEAERRRMVEDKIHAIWRKARESVDRLVEGDTRDRDAFRDGVGEFIPGDLWTEMSGPLRGWDVIQRPPLVVVADTARVAEGVNDRGSGSREMTADSQDLAEERQKQQQQQQQQPQHGTEGLGIRSAAVLDKTVIDAAKKRLSNFGGT